LKAAHQKIKCLLFLMKFILVKHYLQKYQNLYFPFQKKLSNQSQPFCAGVVVVDVVVVVAVLQARPPHPLESVCGYFYYHIDTVLPSESNLCQTRDKIFMSLAVLR